MNCMSQSNASYLLLIIGKLREEEKEVDHRKKNTKGNSRDSKRGLQEKSDAEKNAEELDESFNVSKLLAVS